MRCRLNGTAANSARTLAAPALSTDASTAPPSRTAATSASVSASTRVKPVTSGSGTSATVNATECGVSLVPLPLLSV